jgi:putative ABC transport system permease protein
VKYVPLLWGAMRRNPAESLLTLLTQAVAFALFASMVALNGAYEKAIDDARMDRLFVVCRFECQGLPIAYEEQLARLEGVIGVGATVWLGGHEQDESHQILIMFVDQGMRSAWPELPMTEADWRALQATPAGLFLTRKAAARRPAQVGGVLAMTTLPGSRADGSPTWYFNILGLIDDPPGWGQWTPDLIVGNLRYFQQAARLDERNTANVLRVAVDRADRAREVCREIEARFTNASPAVYCIPARQDAQQLADANINMRQISLAIGAAGLFMILFLSANGIAESVRERLPELGVLKTLGYGDARLVTLIFLEAATPTLLAALLGSAGGSAVSLVARRLAVKGVVNMPEMHLSVFAFALALAAALLISLVSIVAPLQRLRRMDLAAVLAGR